MNWGFIIAWLEVFPHYTEADVRLMAVMLAGMVACVFPAHCPGLWLTQHHQVDDCVRYRVRVPGPP